MDNSGTFHSEEGAAANCRIMNNSGNHESACDYGDAFSQHSLQPQQQQQLLQQQLQLQPQQLQQQQLLLLQKGQEPFAAKDCSQSTFMSLSSSSSSSSPQQCQHHQSNGFVDIEMTELETNTNTNTNTNTYTSTKSSPDPTPNNDDDDQQKHHQQQQQQEYKQFHQQRPNMKKEDSIQLDAILQNHNAFKNTSAELTLCNDQTRKQEQQQQQLMMKKEDSIRLDTILQYHKDNRSIRNISAVKYPWGLTSHDSSDDEKESKNIANYAASGGGGENSFSNDSDADLTWSGLVAAEIKLSGGGGNVSTGLFDSSDSVAIALDAAVQTVTARDGLFDAKREALLLPPRNQTSHTDARSAAVPTSSSKALTATNTAFRADDSEGVVSTMDTSTKSQPGAHRIYQNGELHESKDFDSSWSGDLDSGPFSVPRPKLVEHINNHRRIYGQHLVTATLVVDNSEENDNQNDADDVPPLPNLERYNGSSTLTQQEIQAKLEEERQHLQLQHEREKEHLREEFHHSLQSALSHHNIVEAESVVYDRNVWSNVKRSTCFCLMGVVSLAALVMIIIGLVLGPPNSHKPIEYIVSAPTSSSLPPSLPPSLSPTRSTTLHRIANSGYLRCGVSEDRPGLSFVNPETQQHEGLEVDLCRSIAAAIFGTFENRIDFISTTAKDRFQVLFDGDVDIIARTTTHTMERSISEPLTGAGFSFSIPYLYDGVGFGGDPFFVACVDNLLESVSFEEECGELKICVKRSTTHTSAVLGRMPDVTVVDANSTADLYYRFNEGLCNTIASESFDISELVVRTTGYSGNYTISRNVISKEPLAMVTLNDDAHWSDFVNWIIVGILQSEEQGITQSNALASAPRTDLFGPEFRLMFRDAIRAVGNYAEIYDRHLEQFVPRLPINEINDGNLPLLYSFPHGSLDSSVGDLTKSPTMAAVLDRGYLTCGVSSVFPGFVTSQNGVFSGFDVDFCRAIAAAIFGEATDKTLVFRSVMSTERFQLLAEGGIDVLIRVTTATFARDVRESTSGVGFSFTQTIFYDGLAFAGVPSFVDCADNLLTFRECNELKICVTDGTTTLERVEELFENEFIEIQSNYEESLRGLESGLCNVLAADSIALLHPAVKSLSGYTGPYKVGSNRFSKEPLAPLTRQDDVKWSTFVYWVISSVVYAEENGIVQTNANLMPKPRLWGPLFEQSFVLAIAAVGNYGEIYKRNLEHLVQRGGANELNMSPFGPQHFIRPGINL